MSWSLQTRNLLKSVWSTRISTTLYHLYPFNSCDSADHHAYFHCVQPIHASIPYYARIQAYSLLICIDSLSRVQSFLHTYASSTIVNVRINALTRNGADQSIQCTSASLCNNCMDEVHVSLHCCICSAFATDCQYLSTPSHRLDSCHVAW